MVANGILKITLNKLQYHRWFSEADIHSDIIGEIDDDDLTTMLLPQISLQFHVTKLFQAIYDFFADGLVMIDVRPIPDGFTIHYKDIETFAHNYVTDEGVQPDIFKSGLLTITSTTVCFFSEVDDEEEPELDPVLVIDTYMELIDCVGYYLAKIVAYGLTITTVKWIDDTIEIHYGYHSDIDI